MICSNCGKEIKEGATYCLECGAPIDEPVVLSQLRPKNVKEALAGGEIKEKKSIKDSYKDAFKGSMEYKGSFIDFSGYVKALGNDVSILLGFLGAILVYLSPFFTWLWRSIWREKETASLFEIGGKNGELALDQGVLIFLAILIILSSIDMLAFSSCRFIGPLKSYDGLYLIKILPILITIILFIIIINNSSYESALEYLKTQQERAENLGVGYNFSGGRGIGPVMLISGVALYGLSIFMDYSKRKK